MDLGSSIWYIISLKYRAIWAIIGCWNEWFNLRFKKQPSKF
jgi:hypothetical protein